VPHAAIEELLPAGQLLRQASRKSARDYSLAKSHFLSGLATAAISAGEEFSSQVAALAEAAAVAVAAAAAASGQPLPAGNEASTSATANALSLPGLQELRGTWSGRITAVGDGAAAAATGSNGGRAAVEAQREVPGGVGSGSGSPQLDFDITGSGWRAGPYTLDQVCAAGAVLGLLVIDRYNSCREGCGLLHACAAQCCSITHHAALNTVLYCGDGRLPTSAAGPTNSATTTVLRVRFACLPACLPACLSAGSCRCVAVLMRLRASAWMS
jgi:hypothetical protein